MMRKMENTASRATHELASITQVPCIKAIHTSFHISSLLKARLGDVWSGNIHRGPAPSWAPSEHKQLIVWSPPPATRELHYLPASAWMRSSTPPCPCGPPACGSCRHPTPGPPGVVVPQWTAAAVRRAGRQRRQETGAWGQLSDVGSALSRRWVSICG